MGGGLEIRRAVISHKQEVIKFCNGQARAFIGFAHLPGFETTPCKQIADRFRKLGKLYQEEINSIRGIDPNQEIEIHTKERRYRPRWW